MFPFSVRTKSPPQLTFVISVFASCRPRRTCTQSTVYHNLPYPQVFEHETNNKEGETTANGTYCVSTGQFTGRSPKDKYFVQQVRRKN